jgi:hypothetical protein
MSDETSDIIGLDGAPERDALNPAMQYGKHWERRALSQAALNVNLQFALDHWIAVADTLKQQRDQAEKERDEWKSKYLDEAGAHDKTRRAWGEEAADMTRSAMRDGLEFVSERDALRAERDALRKDAARLCQWREDDPDFGTWRTGCGHLWSFNAGGPEENDAKFCQYCGGALAVALSEATP